MTLRLNGSTSGYVEIDAPATAGSNSIVLPASNGSANQFLKNGGTAGTLGWSSLTENASNELTQNGYPAAFARAWVNFNGTGTVAIRSSFNVSSITDNGTGDYTVNFTTSLVDANYTYIGLGTAGGAVYQIAGGSQGNGTILSTSSFRTQFGFVSSLAGALTNQDPSTACIAIFR